MKLVSLTFFVFVFVAHTAISQHAVKLGLGFQFTDEGSTTTRQFKADVPSYFKFRTASKYIEAGLSEFSILSADGSGLFPRKSTTVNVTPFYEFGRIIGNSEKKLRFKAGGRILFGNEFERGTGGGSDYEYTTFDTGVTFAITPGLFYQLNDKLSIDLGVPIRLITISSHFHKQQGPNFPGVMKRNDGLEGVLLPKIYQFKAGVIYRFGQ